MDRRGLLKTTSTVIAGATLAPRALVGKPALPGRFQGRRAHGSSQSIGIEDIANLLSKARGRELAAGRHVFVSFQGVMNASAVGSVSCVSADRRCRAAPNAAVHASFATNSTQHRAHLALSAVSPFRDYS
jgi:hypothetical protein